VPGDGLGRADVIAALLGAAAAAGLAAIGVRTKRSWVHVPRALERSARSAVARGLQLDRSLLARAQEISHATRREEAVVYLLGGGAAILIVVAVAEFVR
jgi:hypothetical protein